VLMQQYDMNTGVMVLTIIVILSNCQLKIVDHRCSNDSLN